MEFDKCMVLFDESDVKVKPIKIIDKKKKYHFVLDDVKYDCFYLKTLFLKNDVMVEIWQTKEYNISLESKDIFPLLFDDEILATFPIIFWCYSSEKMTLHKIKKALIEYFNEGMFERNQNFLFDLDDDDDDDESEETSTDSNDVDVDDDDDDDYSNYDSDSTESDDVNSEDTDDEDEDDEDEDDEEDDDDDKDDNT